jgi:hypothetical protein
MAMWQYGNVANRVSIGKKLRFLNSVLHKSGWSAPRSGRFTATYTPGSHFTGSIGNVMKQFKKKLFSYSSSIVLVAVGVVVVAAGVVVGIVVVVVVVVVVAAVVV